MNSSSISSKAESGTTSDRNVDLRNVDLGQDHPDAPSATRKDKPRSKRISKKKKTASSRSRCCMPGKQPKITAGCRGDPRMNEAVFLRLSNPKLSMIDVLLRGGFTFGTQPLPPPPGVLDRNVLDDDGVSLQQRKNQLMRRLRKDRDRKKKAKEAKQTQKQKQKRGKAAAVQEDAEQTAASGADGEYYSRIDNRKQRKKKPSAEADEGGTDGSNWQYPAPAAAAPNDDGSSTASIAVDGSVSHVVLGGPTILDRLTALEQVQSALRMNAEMQRQISVEQQQQQQQQQQAPTQQEHVDNDDQGKKVAADDDDAHNRRPGYGHRDNPSQGEATRQEVQELQNNLQRLIEDVLLTESDRHDQDMLQDHLPDSAAVATLTATAAAAQHMHTSANASGGSTSSLKTATQVPLVVHPVPVAVQQPLIAALPTLFGPATVGGGTAINIPNIIGTGTGICRNIGATAAAPAPPLPPPTATITLTGGQYVDQNMLQQQMAAFQRQQVAAFAELAAAAAAAGTRQQNI